MLDFGNGGGILNHIGGNMRKKICSVLLLLLILFCFVACQPSNWWEYYWWMENNKNDGKDSAEPLDVVQALSTYGLLQDIFNPDGLQMKVRWTDSDPVVYTRGSLTNEVESAVYATVTFNQYTGFGLTDKDFSIESGEIVFEFKIDGPVSDGNSVNVLSFTSIVTRDLIFMHNSTSTPYTISDVYGMAGGVDESNKPVLEIDLDSQMSVSLSKSSSISLFDTEQELSAIINGNVIDTAESEFDIEIATGLIEEDEWLRLFVQPEGTGYSVSVVQNGDGTLAYTAKINFNGYYRNGWTIESGSIEYNWNRISTSGNMIRVNSYTAEIPQTAPLRFVSDDGNSEYSISATDLAGTCTIYGNRKSGGADLFDIWAWDSDLSGTLLINGTEYKQTSSYIPTLGELGIRGIGTEYNPYKISTEKQLRGLAVLVNSGTFNTKDIYFRLVNDIDLENREWIPIGTVDGMTQINYQETKDSELKSIFKGHFDGNGYTISNLKITPGLIDSPYVSYSSSYQGLFGIISAGSSISNLTINNAEIIGGGFLGAFAGFIPQTDSNEKVILKNLHLTGDIEIIGDSDVGGILGRCCYLTELEISDCSVIGNNGSVIRTPEDQVNNVATNFVGGIIGTAYSRGNGTILSNCHVSNMDISAYIECVGGITGHFEQGSISNVSVSNTNISLTGYFPISSDTTEAVGAISGTVRGAVGQENEPTSTQVTISGMEFNNVTLNFPVETEINLYGIVGRFRDNERDNTKLNITVEGEGNSVPAGITINNPKV